MKVTIKVEGNKASTRIQAYTFEETQNPLPYLHRAIEELQWQIDNYPHCPVHSDAKARQLYEEYAGDSPFHTWDELSKHTKDTWRHVAKNSLEKSNVK